MINSYITCLRYYQFKSSNDILPPICLFDVFSDRPPLSFSSSDREKSQSPNSARSSSGDETSVILS